LFLSGELGGGGFSLLLAGLFEGGRFGVFGDFCLVGGVRKVFLFSGVGAVGGEGILFFEC